MRLDFTLVGRDHLSRVLDRAGDASNRLGRRLLITSINSDMAMRRFTNNATRNLSQMQRDSEAGEKALGELKKATMLLAPAAIPAAASLAPLAAGAATVGAAMAAMGLAIVPQISALGDAADAEKKWQDTVDKSGATSEEAVTAQLAYQQVLAKLPPKTREAAAAVGGLKDDFKAWSDSLSGDTMAPFIKGVSLVDALLPKTSGMVRVASAEADRFVTIVGGEMASPGLDRLNTEFTGFAQKTLRSVNNEIVHLLRSSQGTNVGGPAREFMEWARAQGPTVAGVLKDVAMALVHVLQAGSGVGVGLLQVVEVVADLVSAVPPGAIATFLQLALALKLTKAAALGFMAVRSAIAGFAVQLLAMQAAAAAAPSRLLAVRAAVAALSRTTKVAMAGTGIGLLILGLSMLAEKSAAAPPDVDKLTSSLKQLGSTGKVTGEASRAFGSDLGGLYDKVRSLTDPSTTDKVQQAIVSLGGLADWDSTPLKNSKANLDSIDKALAGLVQNGNADLAAAALKRLTAEYGKGGRDTSKFTKELDDYKSAVADSKFEQQLAADSMGVFGQQAQSVSSHLDSQKKSADGLRQSIQALNDIQRQGLGGMIGFEASIDAAAKAAKDNAGALSMSHGQLDLNSEKARNAATALQDLADKTETAAASNREATNSWEGATAIYNRGRSELIKSAQAMGLTKSEAKQLADQILNIKDLKKARVEMDTDDAKADLNAFNSAVAKSPGSKSVTLQTLSKSAEQILQSFRYKVTHLKDGSVTVSAKTGGALAGIKNVAGALASLRSKSVTITTNRVTKFSTVGAPGSGGIPVAKRDYATGGRVGFPGGGPVVGPGTGTSDSVPINASNGEYVINARSTAKHLALIEAINADRLGTGVGMPGAGAAVAAGLAAGMTGSTGQVTAAAVLLAAAITAGIKGEMQIASPSKKTKALAADIGKGLIVGLTGSRDKIKSVSADLAKDIKTAFSGKKESSLLKYVDKQTDKLLAAAKKRDALAAKLAEAKQYAADTTKTARGQAALSSLGMDAGEVTAGGIKAGLASKLAQIRQFSRYISMLAKRGLNKGLLRQILDMGPVDGYAYASALAGADKATLTAVSKSQKAIDSETTKLGRKGADLLYDSGKNAGKGFLKGLEGQQKDIEKLMVSIAKGMQKALRKALGIKSPSTVMARLGAFSTIGLARGLVDGLPAVDRALGVVAGRMTGVRPVLGRPAVAAAGGGLTYNINVDIRDAMDPVAVGREVQRMLLQFGRVQGATVSLKVG